MSINGATIYVPNIQTDPGFAHINDFHRVAPENHPVLFEQALDNWQSQMGCSNDEYLVLQEVVERMKEAGSLGISLILSNLDLAVFSTSNVQRIFEIIFR